MQSPGYRAPEVDTWNAFLRQQQQQEQEQQQQQHSLYQQPTNSSHASETCQQSDQFLMESRSSSSVVPNVPAIEQLEVASRTLKVTSNSHEIDVPSSECRTKEMVTPSGEWKIKKPRVASDLWSIGCILVELFTGVKLFSMSTLKDISLKLEQVRYTRCHCNI